MYVRSYECMVFDFYRGTCQLAKYKRCYFVVIVVALLTLRLQSDNIYLRALFLSVFFKKTHSQTLFFSLDVCASACMYVCACA